jgi:hypothetical protein
MVQTIDGGKGIDPQLQAPGCNEILPRTERRPNETARVVYTGTAGGEIGVIGTLERGPELLGARQRRRLQRRLRRLVGPTEVAAAVAIIPPARRVRRLIRDARQGEGLAVN